MEVEVEVEVEGRFLEKKRAAVGKNNVLASIVEMLASTLPFSCERIHFLYLMLVHEEVLGTWFPCEGVLFPRR